MVFNELILALCSICNLYMNTMHLCRYQQKNVINKTGTFSIGMIAIFLQKPGCPWFDEKKKYPYPQSAFQVQCENNTPEVTDRLS